MTLIEHECGLKVSECGRVFGQKGERRPSSNGKYGYLRVTMREGTKGNYKYSTQYIHRLVAQLYVPNPENKPEVNHKDKDVTNNHYTNLEWVTAKENTQHALANGRIHNFSKEWKYVPD